jgi:monoamine oxidase
MAKTRLFGKLRKIAREVLHPERAETRGAGVPRRDVLKGVLALGAASALPACGGDDDEGGGTKPSGVRIAIVGGGIAGVHAAYRLKQAGVSATVYEATGRVGGRMYTARGEFADDLICELGGELIDSNHATLLMLADEFGLVLDDRMANAPANYVVDTWWVAGQKVPEATVVTQFTAVAPAFAQAELDADSDDAKFTELDEMTLSDFLDQNVPVAQYAELHAILTAAYRGEFGLETSEQSALNMLYLIDSDTPDPFRIFGDSDEIYHAHLGSDSFVSKLAESLTGSIQLDTKLVAARDAGDAFELDFEKKDGTKSSATFDHVVFALPFSVLREVDLTGLTLSDDKRSLIAELGYGTNAKVMGEFSERVWLTQHTSSGSVTADEPFQQTWDTSIGQAGQTGVLTNFLGGQQGTASGSGTADEWMVGILPQLDAVFPGVQAAYTGTAVRMHWPTVPTAKGSYTCYTPGQWGTQGIEGSREGNVHFCGEHCSIDFQGWMEGGAESGGLVAAEILDDLGITQSALMKGFVALKTRLPHPCYHADRFGRVTWRERRRLRRELRASSAL